MVSEFQGSRSESQNPHPNVAKSATLGWGTRESEEMR